MQLNRMTCSSNLFLSIFLLFIISFAYSSSSFNKCSPQQSLALLLFKQNLSSTNHSFDYDYNVNSVCQYRLGSRYHPIMMNWNTSTDCCKWDGITCDHLTGDVIGIDLSCGMLHGTLHPNSTLFHLPHLQRLSLAFNNFTSSQLPREIDRFSSSLTHLNLSDSGFTGQIPSEITLLSKLVSLDLSWNNDGLQIQPSVFNILLQNSTHLRELLVAFVDISWVLPTYINISSSLQSLDLSATGLQGKLPVNIFSLPYLQKLHLSFNDQLTGPLPKVNKNANISLQFLDLSDCNLMGPLPEFLVSLIHLTSLDLSLNKLNGTFPSWLFTLPSLVKIFLGHNMFNGEINQSSIQLTYLTHLDLSSNNLMGLWDLDTLLSNLPNLIQLELSSSGLSVVASNVTAYVNPDFSALGLGSCNLTLFPESLKAMKNLAYLNLSSNGIKGQIPDWTGGIGGSRLRYLDLSNNSITGLPKFHWDKLRFLTLKSNQIEGEFPPSICNSSNLLVLDMSFNRFHGVIPQCFGRIVSSSLFMVDMSNNHFHGTIPNAYGECEPLFELILNGNQLQGEVPSFLSKCQDLTVLDIGNNQLNGTFPSWLGDLPELQILVLKSNKLHGSMETSTTVEHPFPSLRVLDLSHNRLVGQLPKKYFQSFIAMKDVVVKGQQPHYLAFAFLIGANLERYYSGTFSVKGQERNFSKVLDTFTLVDLSGNRFEGEIPMVIGSLNFLKVLNLSHNNLKGQIPHALGNLSAVETLDLSWNQLIGEIPQSLADITNLEVLNLSQNHLVGQIPKGKQFNTFDEYSFGGNSGLCGFPMPQLCEHSSSQQVKDDRDEDEEESGFTWKVVMLGYGCGTVIGLVMGYIMLSTGKPKWFNAIADAIERTFLKRKK